MRRNEITPELIELSKRAKELGFPQDVEEVSWVLPDGYKKPVVRLVEEKEVYVLILSFSRCLEWLRERGNLTYFRLTVYGAGPIKFFIQEIAKYFTERGLTHHEAIAKAVVKILEGEG